MHVPTIHLNGTPAGRLQEPLCEAHSALNETLDKLAECAPNGRDYYPQGEAAINEATREHRARLTAIQAVMADLLAIHEAIDDAVALRELMQTTTWEVKRR